MFRVGCGNEGNIVLQEVFVVVKELTSNRGICSVGSITLQGSNLWFKLCRSGLPMFKAQWSAMVVCSHGPTEVTMFGRWRCFVCGHSVDGQGCGGSCSGCRGGSWFLFCVVLHCWSSGMRLVVTVIHKRKNNNNNIIIMKQRQRKISWELPWVLDNYRICLQFCSASGCMLGDLVLLWFWWKTERSDLKMKIKF